MSADPARTAAILAAARSAAPRFVEELASLVAIPSGTYDHAGVERVAEALAPWFAELGAAIEVRLDGEPARCGPTLVARFTGERPGARIAAIGHLDTVAAAGDPAPALAIRDGRAYGMGAADMKGGLLALVHALRAIRAVTGSAVPAGELVVIAGPDEEIGSPAGSVAIRELVPGSAAALVLEPARANGALVAARKGMLQAQVRIRGRAAHAGVEPEKGRSAILAAAHATIALHAIGGHAGGIPGVTCSVGTIAGGTRPNVVAEEVVLELDLRAPTALAMAEAEAAIEAILASPAVPDVTMTLDVAGHFPPMERAPTTAALLAVVRRAGDALGIGITAVATGGASDANLVAALGVPVLDGLGPPGAGMHGPDESLELAAVPARVALLALTLLELGGGKGLEPA